ncbi:TPA: hypothetical protein QDB06_001740 [Burkholderia vietnamiensis]|uniref:hypothetical protein n=1 Tax=Burkholderia vietnamiensis TaxID=60552 RepID=UPI0015927681|nr:hypothetical protein [Burkholderia vietnamiensis]HDR9181187.1 hypothetical protein [Burkholderia vietnamiensis]
MKMFGKNSSNSGATLEAAPTRAKRDVTISNEPKKRPDHVKVETNDATWSIPLTLDEQYTLGQSYEQGTDDEAAMLTAFTETLYQSDEGGAVKLAIEIRLLRPGEVFLTATGNRQRFSKSGTVRFDEIGLTLCTWLAEAQTRPDLVADLVAALADDRG